MEQRIARLKQFAGSRDVPAPAAGTMIFAHLTEKMTADPAAPVRDFLINYYGVEPAQAGEVLVAGTPGQVADQLAAYRAVGVTEFITIPFGPDLPVQYQLTAQVRSILQS
jgi:alkanesulfonate monooxygenase SsuD/methylene tetrahydromethanopterin reductase-like flavin-dependent oxidoreductase (luciferase family)